MVKRMAVIVLAIGLLVTPAYAELEIDSKILRETENSDIVIKTTLYR